MKIKSMAIMAVFAGVAGCGGGGCPSVFIPAYEVNVYDSISGELLCTEQRDLNSTGACEIAYAFPEEQDGVADITVELEGYETQTLEAVPNELGQHACFDSWDYMAKVDVFLERSL